MAGPTERVDKKAFGFSKRDIMDGPDGKPIHAELTLRGTTLMLGPENEAMGKRTAKTVGASPAGLFIYVENVDKVVDKATNSAPPAKDRCAGLYRQGGDSGNPSKPLFLRVSSGNAHSGPQPRSPRPRVHAGTAHCR